MGDVLKNGNCVVCTSEAVLACQRCGDFYCSSKCQRKDWQSHRYICIPMPALVHPKSFSIYSVGNSQKSPDAKVENVPEANQLPRLENAADNIETKLESIQVAQITPPKKMLTETPRPILVSDKMEDSKSEPNNSNNNNHNNNNKSNSNNNGIISSNIIKKIKHYSPLNMPMPANKSIVYITGFRSPNRCFIRDASEEADKAYSNILEMVDKLGKELPKMIKPRNNQYVLSTYNGKLQRAKVLSANYDNLRLLFLDQGVIKVRHASSVIEVSDEIMSLPCYTLQVQLQGVANYAISDKIIKFLTQFENEKFVGLYGHNDNNPNNAQLELFNAETQKSLNKQINEFCADKQLYDMNEPKAQALNKIASVSPTTEIVQKEADIVKATKDTDIAQKEPDIVKAKVNDNKVNEAEAVSKKPQSPLEDLQKETVETQPINDSKPILEEITDSKVVAVPVNNKIIEKETVTKAVETKLAKPEVVPEPIVSKEKPSSLNGIVQTKQEPVLVAPFESVCFKGNPKNGLDVFVVDNTNIRRGVFGALDSAHAKEFSELQILLSEFNDPQPYEPVLKEYVIVKSDGVWNRAKVTQIEPPYYKVMFLEFINSEKVTMKDIRRYPIELTVPCFTNMCFIEEIPNQLNEAQIAHLMETFKVHGLVHIDSVTYLHNIAGVRCKKLLEELEKLKVK